MVRFVHKWSQVSATSSCLLLLQGRRVGSCSCVTWEVSWLYLWDEGQGCGSKQVELWSVVDEAVYRKCGHDPRAVLMLHELIKA